MFLYREASNDMLNRIWNKSIAAHNNSEQWLRWKDEYISYNMNGLAKTFIVSFDGEPVGEGTLIISPLCSAIRGRPKLTNGFDTVNINALRTEKSFEGRGHISKLVKIMEEYARQNEYKHITIGVEADQTRTLSIYLHWGYDNFVGSCTEDGSTVLYYQKNL